MKRCPICKDWKTLSQFTKNKLKKDGFGSYCLKCNSEKSRQHRADHAEKKSESNRRWQKNNPDKVRELRRKWQAANPDKVREANRKWHLANPETQRKSTRKWITKHPEKNREQVNNYRARKVASGGKITAKEWKDLCDEYGNMCLRCKRTDVKLTLDHVKPLKLGGSNTIDNAQPLCKLCNSIKQARHIDYRP